MTGRAWLWLACISLLSSAACGDDAGDDGTVVGRDDAGSDAGMDAGHDSGPPEGDGAAPDASKDAASDAEPEDAGADAGDAAIADSGEEPGTVPSGWTCLDSLYRDGFCDCGCSEHDVDCSAGDCTAPGCLGELGICQACFTSQGSWQSCAQESEGTLAFCDPGEIGGAPYICDCGCGVADPDCMGEGCSEPGCRRAACEIRHGCEDPYTDPSDMCSDNNPPEEWECPSGSYGTGDGCDCGCGAIDPDCAGQGCSQSQCYSASCDRCNDGDGRPYGCAAAAAGWAHDSQCNWLHFDAGDGCDCGCGAIDPDCAAGDGCSEPGCEADGCERCTDPEGAPGGCDVPTAWLLVCPAHNYGTGDGCDCGCGAEDPDCNDMGSADPGSLTAACDVCRDPLSPHPQQYVPCPSWTCGDFDFDDAPPPTSSELAMQTADCDCGCGVIDPYCRDLQQASCTEPDCEMPTCEYCNDEGSRTECGPLWASDPEGTCRLDQYDTDGLCDCGCGADDPDCAGAGCRDQGCMAPGCDVCHNGTTLASCEAWRCAPAAYADDDGVCDCGCGIDDPDCAGGGCKEPGCSASWSDGDPPEQACDVCHDPFGRVVQCP